MLQTVRQIVPVRFMTVTSDKKNITISDVKRVLEENEIPFSNEELNELMLEADPNNTGYISFDSFLKLCIESR